MYFSNEKKPVQSMCSSFREAQVILRFLEDLENRLGMSYLFVSHDLNVVRLLCQRVLVMYLGKSVEADQVAELFERPRHPYTKALLSAVPAVEKGDRTERIRLLGEPMSPIDPSPNLCRFYSRCPKADAFCQSEMPALRPYTGGAEAACHYPAEYAEPPEEKVRIAGVNGPPKGEAWISLRCGLSTEMAL